MKVDSSSGLYAVCAITEEDLIKVDLKDLILRESSLKTIRKYRLLALSYEALLGREEQVFYHLLSYSRCALFGVAALHVLYNSSRDTDRIDPVMAIKGGVLRCKEGLAHHIRNLLQLYWIAALGIKLRQ